jgi:hypothetical protein
MGKRLPFIQLVLAGYIASFPLALLAQNPLTAHYRDRSVYQGRAKPDLSMKSMVFAFRLQNRPDLERLLSDQQDPMSPDYHRWLSPRVLRFRP